MIENEKKPQSHSTPPENRKVKFNLPFFILMFLILILVQRVLTDQTSSQIKYNEFRQLMAEGKVQDVVVRGERLEAVLKEPNQEGKKLVITNRIDPELVDELEGYKVNYWSVIESTFFTDILSWVLPFIIFMAFWIFLSRRIMGAQGGSLMNVGKSRAKIYVEKDVKVTFKDVAGVDEAKYELEEIIHFLKDPNSYGRLGAKMPKGVLLVGPPGTGKTLMARAVAGEAEVPFFSISGSEFVEMFVGVGAARVRDLFEQARKHAPCIIFIDELDALGKARGIGSMHGGNDEKEQTLNQLLVELDGFDPTIGVVLLAATNRPEILDQALLRAGRFDRQVLVDKPDKPSRVAILKVHVKKVKLDEDVKLEHVAALTPGFTGADLANLVNEAALSATRADRNEVTMEDFNRAIERIIAGLEKKSRVLNELERKTVAYHELGHAFVAAAIPGCDKVHKVSIIPRGIGALGYTISRPTEDRYLMSKLELENKMAVLLGGRASEKLFFGNISTGSADDVQKATEIAKSITMKYAMIEELGHIVYDESQPKYVNVPDFLERRNSLSEKTTQDIEKKIKEIVQGAFDKAYTILQANRDLLDQGAKELLEKETLSEAELAYYFKQLKLFPQIHSQNRASGF